jgi:hypothetical protein
VAGEHRGGVAGVVMAGVMELTSLKAGSRLRGD